MSRGNDGDRTDDRRADDRQAGEAAQEASRAIGATNLNEPAGDIGNDRPYDPMSPPLRMPYTPADNGPLAPRYDVVVIGGGLAGQSLSRHLLLETDKTVLLLERREELPQKKQKYGESSVQLAGFYFSKVLDLEEYLLREHYLKYNLRFYWPSTGRSNEGFEDMSHGFIHDLSNVASYQRRAAAQRIAVAAAARRAAGPLARAGDVALRALGLVARAPPGTQSRLELPHPLPGGGELLEVEGEPRGADQQAPEAVELRLRQAVIELESRRDLGARGMVLHVRGVGARIRQYAPITCDHRDAQRQTHVERLRGGTPARRVGVGMARSLQRGA